MDISFTVTDERKLAGLAAACLEYNKFKTAENPEFVQLTSQQYVEFVMNSAMDSYANNHLGPAPTV